MSISSPISKENTKSDIFELSDFKVLFKKPKAWTTPLGSVINHQPFKKYLRTDIKSIFESQGIQDPDLEAREIVGQVFPFKINQHIIDQINWKNYQTDPLPQLTFPQKEMLSEEEIRDVVNLKKEMHQEKSSPKRFLIYEQKRTLRQPINRQLTVY